MSCNLIYKDKKLIEVVNDQGQPSQLYKEAVSRFGEEQALDIFYTSKSDNFTEIFGTEEPNLETVVNYITEENQIKEALSIEQKIDLQDFALEVENFDPQTLIDTFYDEFGIFTVSTAKLKASNLYSDYEIRNLQSDVELQERVRLSIEALKNTEEVEIQQDITTEVEKTGEINSFGKMSSLNPFVVQKDVVEKLGGTTEQEFNEAIEDLDYPNFQKSVNKEELFQEMQAYKKADVFIEVDGEIRQKRNTETQVVIPLTTKVVTNQTVKNNVNSLIELPLGILVENADQTQEVLKTIEDDLIAEGLDVVGLSEKTIDPDLIEFLQELNLFLNNPSSENTKIYSEISDSYFERDLNPSQTKIKAQENFQYVKLNTNLSEEEVYVKSGLIKVREGLYIKSAKEDLNTLYTTVGTYTEKYPSDKIIEEYVQEQVTTMNDFNNIENAEAVTLYKMYFNILKQTVEVNRDENGNLLAPNGKISNLTEEQWGLVRTPEFKTWFGDWQNNPKNASKVVDKNGEPLIYFHGTSEEFNVFNKEKMLSGEGAMAYGTGFYFTPAISTANTYRKMSSLDTKGGRILSVFLNVKNPMYWEDEVTKKDRKKIDEYLEDNQGSFLPRIAKSYGNAYKHLSDQIIGGKNKFVYRDNTEINDFLQEILGFDSISHFTQEDYEEDSDMLGKLSQGADEEHFIIFNPTQIKSATDIKGTTSTETNDIRFLKKASPTKNTENFTGNVEYLTGEFISDFWAKSLKAKQQNNAIWKNYYSNIGVNEKGLYLINDDVLTIAKINEYADENMRQYSILSKQMPKLTLESEIIETRQSLRNSAVNTPSNVVDFDGQIYRLNSEEIITKDSSEDFIKIGGEVFENVATQGSLKHYVKLEKNNTEYNLTQVAEPTTNLNITDYNYLETSTQDFTTVKKYKNLKNSEDFNC